MALAELGRGAAVPDPTRCRAAEAQSESCCAIKVNNDGQTAKQHLVRRTGRRSPPRRRCDQRRHGRRCAAALGRALRRPGDHAVVQSTVEMLRPRA